MFVQLDPTRPPRGPKHLGKNETPWSRCQSQNLDKDLYTSREWIALKCQFHLRCKYWCMKKCQRRSALPKVFLTIIFLNNEIIYTLYIIQILIYTYMYILIHIYLILHDISYWFLIDLYYTYFVPSPFGWPASGATTSAAFGRFFLRCCKPVRHESRSPGRPGRHCPRSK